jgi:hypothetical protein
VLSESTTTTSVTGPILTTVMTTATSTLAPSTLLTTTASSQGQLTKVWECTFDSNDYCGGIINQTSGIIELKIAQLISYLNGYYLTDVTSISKAALI